MLTIVSSVCYRAGQIEAVAKVKVTAKYLLIPLFVFAPCYMSSLP